MSVCAIDRYLAARGETRPNCFTCAPPPFPRLFIHHKSPFAVVRLDWWYSGVDDPPLRWGAIALGRYWGFFSVLLGNCVLSRTEGWFFFFVFFSFAVSFCGSFWGGGRICSRVDFYFVACFGSASIWGCFCFVLGAVHSDYSVSFCFRFRKENHLEVLVCYSVCLYTREFPLRDFVFTFLIDRIKNVFWDVKWWNTIFRVYTKVLCTCQELKITVILSRNLIWRWPFSHMSLYVCRRII